jgi:hypothetical protein
MQLSILTTTCFGLMAVAATLHADEKNEPWTALFNGKDLTGWKIHPKPSGSITEVIPIMTDGKLAGYDGKLKDGKTIHLWRVEDGVLIGAGPPSHLFSERGDYTNFRYRIEAQINDKGNSGQYFRTTFAPGFPPGYEAQINATGGDPIRTGSLYPDGRTKLKDHRKDICVMNTAPHKADEWFVQEVTMIDDQITIQVNGKQTISWKDPYKSHTKGHFALQGHDPGTVVRFRKIEVIEIK